MRRGRRWLWFKADGPGRRKWKVWLTDKRIWLNGEELRGHTDSARMSILITLRQPSLFSLHKTAMHELIHAGCGPNDAAALTIAGEEETAYRCEAGLTRILSSITVAGVPMGFQFPPLPEGAALLS